MGSAMTTPSISRTRGSSRPYTARERLTQRRLLALRRCCFPCIQALRRSCRVPATHSSLPRWSERRRVQPRPPAWHEQQERRSRRGSIVGNLAATDELGIRGAVGGADGRASTSRMHCATSDGGGAQDEEPIPCVFGSTARIWPCRGDAGEGTRTPDTRTMIPLLPGSTARFPGARDHKRGRICAAVAIAARQAPRAVRDGSETGVDLEAGVGLRRAPTRRVQQ